MIRITLEIKTDQSPAHVAHKIMEAIEEIPGMSVYSAHAELAGPVNKDILRGMPTIELWPK